ncbi:MAG: hypothetical protein V3V18_11200 [Methylococcales bacterium]
MSEIKVKQTVFGKISQLYKDTVWQQLMSKMLLDLQARFELDDFFTNEGGL